MPIQHKLIVSVQDFAYQYTKADVAIRPAGRKEWTEVPAGNTPGIYELTDFVPGEYELRVGGREELSADERTVTLQAGLNQFHTTLAPAGTPYYVAADSEKVYFTPVPDQLMVEFPDPATAERVQRILREDQIELARPPEQVEPSAGSERYFLQLPDEREAAGKLLQRIQEKLSQAGLRGITWSKPILKGKAVLEGLTNQLILKCSGDVTREAVRQLAKEFRLRLVREITYLGNGFLLRHGEYPDYDILEVAAALRRVPGVAWVEINRVESITADAFTPNDFLYPELPHLPLVNADDAWDTLDDINVNLRAGNSDITIAVFDPHGIAPDHPDLTGTLTDGTAKQLINFNFRSMLAQAAGALAGNHGTQCASSATGRFHDGSGGAGIAGNCHLIGARLASTTLDTADAWLWAAGLPTGNTDPNWPAPVTRPADVISNSWGNDGGALPSLYRDAFNYLTTYGRNGRGCLVCFSIGNNGYIDFATDPSRRRVYAAYAKTIAVGASISANPTSPVTSRNPDPNGNTTNLAAVTDTRAFYSPFGQAIDVVAPSHTSTALVGIFDPVLSAVRRNMGDVPADGGTVTTLAAAAAAGATLLQVASTAGIVAGMALVINAPGSPNRDYHRITAVTSNQLSLNGNLANSYPSGTTVSVGAADYDFTFGGTSHACPTVAGTLALILSVNPLLSWVQAREILRTSAVRIDFGQTNLTGQWTDNDGDGVNEYSQWYGYGRIDVDAAVIQAQDTTNLADIVIRDNLADTGATPSAGWHAHSPDIWVRQTDDAIPTLSYTAGPPHQNALRGQDNYVYLRVKNTGSVPTNQAYLRALICHFPGFEFRYPQEWMPTTRSGDPIPTPLVPGTYLIDARLIDNLAPGADQIVKMTWPAALVPPETVNVAGIDVNWHPCILAEASPHDGDAPATTGHAVKDNNNLAHRNIRVDDGTDTDSFAVGVMAGTSGPDGIEAVILDRSALAAGHRVFIRTADPKHMQLWMERVKAGKISTAKPLPGDEAPQYPGGEESCSKFILTEDTRLTYIDCDGTAILIEAPKNTEIKLLQEALQRSEKPDLHVDTYQGQDVIVFSGGGPAIELPCRLPSRKFMPLVIGILRSKDEEHTGVLKATQRKTNGELSAGYTIEG